MTPNSPHSTHSHKSPSADGHHHSHSNPFFQQHSHDHTHEENHYLDIEHYYAQHAQQPYQTDASEPSEPSQVDRIMDRYHLLTVIHSIQTYGKFQNLICNKIWQYFSNLTEEHFNMIPVRETIMLPLVRAIESNNILLGHILEDYEKELDVVAKIQNRQLNLGFPIDELPSMENRSKLQSTIKQCMRDWSKEGARERDQCYKPILDELERQFPISKSERQKIRVLSPGSGLGRLPYEIVKRGFSSEGNEFSYFMLLFSNFFLNRTERLHQFEIFPWINHRSNLKERKHQFQSYKVPDEIPSQYLHDNEAQFSMAAGDFIDLYSNQPSQWDVICTCFFIDTARNIFEYVETIQTALKPGGLWINFGPLLYHFADMSHHFSIEIAHDELMQVIEKMGFTTETQRFESACQYASHPESMLRQEYDCSFFVARLTGKTETEGQEQNTTQNEQ